MIGLLLITHDQLGEALMQCVCHVFNGCPPQLAQLGLAASDDPQSALPAARRVLQSVDSGQGVLVLTDLFGATPANVTRQLLEPGRIEAVAGVNLPMLLRSLTYREQGMPTLLEKAVSGGRDGILNLSLD